MPQDELTCLQRTVFTMRIILFALAGGLAVFAGIAVFNVWSQNGPLAPNNDLITWAMIAFAVPVLLLQFVVPTVILNSMCRRMMSRPESATVEQLLNAYRSQVIMGWSMCEGAAFSVLTAFMLEGNPITLGIAGAALILMMMRLPTVNGMAAWLERQEDMLANRLPDELQTS